MNFRNPSDCEITKQQMTNQPIGKIEIHKDGDVSKPWFKESMISQPVTFKKKRVVLLDVDNFYSSDLMKFPCNNSTWFSERN